MAIRPLAGDSYQQRQPLFEGSSTTWPRKHLFDIELSKTILGVTSGEEDDYVLRARLRDRALVLSTILDKNFSCF
jgi:hypothetical protein